MPKNAVWSAAELRLNADSCCWVSAGNSHDDHGIQRIIQCLMFEQLEQHG